MERKRHFSWLRDGRVLTACGGCLAGFLLGMLAFGSLWHLPPAWGDIPGWITAIATIGLLSGAVITARYAIKAFREQAKEVALLTKESERQAIERRRAQAARVFTGVPRDPVRLVSPYLKNASELPIFDVQLWYSSPNGLWGPDEPGVMLSGEAVSGTRSTSVEVALAETVLTFRDAGSVLWVRMPDGAFHEQAHATVRESVLAALGQPVPTPASGSGDVGERQATASEQ